MLSREEEGKRISRSSENSTSRYSIFIACPGLKIGSKLFSIRGGSLIVRATVKEGRNVVALVVFSGFILFLFGNGKAVQRSFETRIRNVVDGCASLLNLDERMHFPDATAVKLHRRYYFRPHRRARTLPREILVPSLVWRSFATHNLLLEHPSTLLETSKPCDPPLFHSRACSRNG